MSHRYNVRRITGKNLDEVLENLRIFLNGLPEEEDCVTVTLGIKDLIVVTEVRQKKKVELELVQKDKAPEEAAVEVSPIVEAEKVIFDAGDDKAPAEEVKEVEGSADLPSPDAMGAMFGAMDGAAEEGDEASKEEQKEDAAAEEDAAKPKGAPRPAMIFRNCPQCSNQLILPTLPITAMCPHCKSTVEIKE